MKCPKCQTEIKDVHFRNNNEAQIKPCSCNLSRSEDEQSFVALEMIKQKKNQRRRSQIRRRG